MHEPSPTVGRLVCFRLTDIPEPVRQRGKSLLLKKESDFVTSLAIGAAAETPSSRVYWVTEAAFQRVMGPGRKRNASAPIPAPMKPFKRGS